MRVYLLTTGTLSGRLTLVHVWGAAAESATLARDPWFVLVTVLAAALCLF
jgi:hypothetical protein